MSASVMCEPMNPAPPVTTAFFISNILPVFLNLSEYTVSGPSRGHKDTDSLQQNEYIEQKRAVCEVIEVEGELRFGFHDVGTVMGVSIVPHLRPTSKPGSDEVPRVVIRYARIVLRRESRQFGALTHGRWVAAQYIPQLRKFVEPQEPQPIADTCDREGGFASRPVVALVVSAHAPEFVNADGLLKAAYAFLHDKYLTAVVELDSKYDDGIEDERNKRPECRTQNINDPLEDVVHARGTHICKYPFILHE